MNHYADQKYEISLQGELVVRTRGTTMACFGHDFGCASIRASTVRRLVPVQLDMQYWLESTK